MPRDNEEDRRRSPRFNCGGEARIYSLPSDGLHVPGRLRNLSLGGVCLDMSHVFDLGTRTEILVSVNAASFRTLGLVKAAQPLRASIEFVQMSAGSRDLLADLIAEFERLAVAANKLRSERMKTEEQLRQEMKQAGVRVARLSGCELSTARASREDRSAHESAEQERIVELAPLLLKIDLFG